MSINEFFFRLLTVGMFSMLLTSGILEIFEPESSIEEKIISVIMYVFVLISFVAAIIGGLGMIWTILKGGI